MKIIFLDFDGVLCNRESIAAGYKARTCPEQDPYGPHADCIAALNWIIEQTQAVIVVSSTWRSAGLPRMRDTLGRWGVCGEVIDVTPRLRGDDCDRFAYQKRGEEVRRWLESYRRYCGPITSFVIIDDDNDFAGAMRERLVRTSMAGGLTMAHAEQAIELLNKRVEVAA